MGRPSWRWVGVADGLRKIKMRVVGLRKKIRAFGRLEGMNGNSFLNGLLCQLFSHAT